MLTVVETLLFRSSGPCTGLRRNAASSRRTSPRKPRGRRRCARSGGIRKVRWRGAGSGKSGGVSVIYVARTVEEEIVLLTLYAKSTTDNLTGAKLKEICRALES